MSCGLVARRRATACVDGVGQAVCELLLLLVERG
jgi:hypothetical protein